MLGASKKVGLVLASYPKTLHLYGVDLVGDDDDSGPAADKEDLQQSILVPDLMDATFVVSRLARQRRRRPNGNQCPLCGR
jgi:hypothetical protein